MLRHSRTLDSLHEVFKTCPDHLATQLCYEAWQDERSVEGQCPALSERWLLTRREQAGGLTLSASTMKEVVYWSPEKVADWLSDMVLIACLTGPCFLSKLGVYLQFTVSNLENWF